MIRIAISAEAFEAIARTLPLGSVAYEAEASGASLKRSGSTGSREVALNGGK